MTARKGEARSIGVAVIRAVEIMERYGAMRGMTLQHYMAEKTNIDYFGKLLKQAEAYGLAEKLDTRPATYIPAQNWRKVLTTPLEPRSAPIAKECKGVCSVWDMARRCESSTRESA